MSSVRRRAQATNQGRRCTFFELLISSSQITVNSVAYDGRDTHDYRGSVHSARASELRVRTGRQQSREFLTGADGSRPSRLSPLNRPDSP